MSRVVLGAYQVEIVVGDAPSLQTISFLYKLDLSRLVMNYEHVDIAFLAGSNGDSCSSVRRYLNSCIAFLGKFVDYQLQQAGIVQAAGSESLSRPSSAAPREALAITSATRSIENFKPR